MTANGFHGNQNILNDQSIHSIVRWKYADGTARLAATGFTINDGYGVAFQESDSTYWVLTSYSPIVWDEMTSSNSTLAGDVTGPLASNTISNDVVTFAKMQNIATNSLIGRDTAGSGDPETILLNATLEMDGSNNLQRAALTGDITATAGSNTTAIAAGVIVNADVNASAAIDLSKLQTITTDRLLGRDTAGTGSIEQVSLGNGLAFSGSTSITTNIDGTSLEYNSGAIRRAAITGDVTIAAGANSATVTDLTITSEAQGDILYRNATNWVRLAASTDGYVLTTHGAAANPTWAASSGGGLTPGTITGQILYWNGSAFVVLNPGTDGYVLTTHGNGAAPTWARPLVKQTVITADATYTPTTGMQYCKVQIWGGGGWGASATTAGGSASCGAGGGGGGGYAEDLFSAAQIGVSKAVVIGAGGTSAAVNGGNSTFGSTLLVANGGSSAPAGTSTGGSGGFNLGGAGGTASGSSGAASLRTYSGTRGGDGGSYVNNSATTGGFVVGGSGGMPWGGMANPSRIVGNNNSSGDVSQQGSVGIGPGSGGSGSVNFTENATISGANGFRGECIITEYIYA